MKRKEVAKNVRSALKNLNEFIDCCRGDKSDCVVENLDQAPTYLESWVTWKLRDALEELEDGN